MEHGHPPSLVRLRPGKRTSSPPAGLSLPCPAHHKFSFLPLQIDYSDIFSIMAFFRGHPSNLRGSHERVARRIASNGQCWVERTWRKEDMQAYSFRLYLEYARMVHPDRDSGAMDYKPGSRLPPAGSSPQVKAGEEKKKKLTGIGKVEPVKEKPAPVVVEETVKEHEQEIKRRRTIIKPDAR